MSGVLCGICTGGLGLDPTLQNLPECGDLAHLAGWGDPWPSRMTHSPGWATIVRIYQMAALPYTKLCDLKQLGAPLTPPPPSSWLSLELKMPGVLKGLH